ncbi:MAG: radical SAM protein [Desulfotignum sp.]|nr:radical SAM protein [Desulfotignum sp.]
MKLLFVNPVCLDPRVTDADATVVPVGLYYLAAQMLDEGFEAAILNLAQPGVTDPDATFTEALDAFQPDLIGFSVTNPTRFSAMSLARIVRQIRPQTVIVFGGPAPTFMADYFFSTCKALDIIVKGEGEQTCLALVHALAGHRVRKDQKNVPDFSRIPGLVFRDGNTLKHTGPAPLIQDLDRLVHPSRYFAFQHLAMSRGCPGACSFCGSPLFWGTRQVRFHSPEWFFEEIRTLAGKGISHFYISDDTFTMDRDRVMHLCRKLIHAGLDITWHAISRVDRVDPLLLDMMRKAGCIQISYGVESGSDAVRKRLGKPVPNTVAIQAFQQTVAAGMIPRAYFIYGSPGETPDTIQESIDLLMQLQPLGAVFYLLVTFPGTRLYEQAKKTGRVTDEIWHRKIEDLPWFEMDGHLDFDQVQQFGNALRRAFYDHLPQFAANIKLSDDPSLKLFHADFLSRLGMTFSHGDYSTDDRITNPDGTAQVLFERALACHPDIRAFLGLGMLFLKHRSLDPAITILDQGLAHFPSNKDLVLCKGICLMNQHRFGEARACLSPFEQHADVRHYLAVCQQQLETHP